MSEATRAEAVQADPVQADAVQANAVPSETGSAMASGAAAEHGGLITITDVGPMIVATVALPGCEPGRALAAFTDPVVLARWWRGELTADLAPGGHYTVSFPKIPARMVGNVVSYVPGRSLEFSWAWDGEDEPPSTVTVRAEPADAGSSTALTVEHGPHGQDEAGRKAHTEHWEGWEYFLPGLPAAVAGTADGTVSG
jgi:uncharacterized protein YndB with AHSA1/START domain